MMIYAGFILPFILFGTCQSESNRVKFRQINDVIVPSSTISTMEKTRMGCCRFCASQNSCTAVLYYPTSLTCEVISLSTQLWISPATKSTAGSLYIKGTTYKLVRNLWSWFEAKTNCEVDGGQLVKIDSVEEHNQLLSWLQQYGHNSVPESSLWIGLNDLEQEGKFSWLDGSPLADFQPWVGPNPSNTGGQEHCVQIIISHNGWNDIHCTYQSWSICEYD